MFSGAQVSLYPMSDDFVGIILGAIGALEPWRDRLRVETDPLSTLMVGPPEVLFPAMRDLFLAAAMSGVHTHDARHGLAWLPRRTGRPDLHAGRGHDARSGPAGPDPRLSRHRRGGPPERGRRSRRSSRSTRSGSTTTWTRSTAASSS